MELLSNFGSLLLDGTPQIPLILLTLTLSVKVTLLEMEQNKIKAGLSLFHMDQTILLQTPQTLLQ